MVDLILTNMQRIQKTKKMSELLCYNPAGTLMAVNPVPHERTKHIDVHCHFEL